MSDTTTTTNMGMVLPVPGPSGRPGPSWATDLISALQLLDSHNHASGSGARITPAGMSINQDLTFGGFNATNLNSSRYSSLVATLSGSSDKNCVYVVGGNLYFNNNSGTAIQLTSGGSINVASIGAITGDYSTAGAAISYNNTTKNYTFFQGAPNTTYLASLTAGSVTVTEMVASGNGVTLKVPASFAASYSMTLPASLPGSTLPVSMSNTGALSCAKIINAQMDVDSVDTSQIKAAAVTLDKTAADVIPPGTIWPSARRTAPAGWLLPYGQEVSRSTYAGLYVALAPTLGTITVTIASPAVFTLASHGLQVGDRIRLSTTGALPTGLAANTDYYISAVPSSSTFRVSATLGGADINTSGTQSGTHTAQYFPYGAGDGSTTFNLPDLRGRTFVGADAMGGSAASRLTSGGSGIYGAALGAAGGAETHTLTTAQMPVHSHGVTDPGHVHAINAATFSGNSDGIVPSGPYPQPGNTASATTGITIQNAGSGNAHNNTQPSFVGTFIIKT